MNSNSRIKKPLVLTLIALGMLIAAFSVRAQTQVYSQNFDADDSANWSSNSTAAAGAALSFNGANFNFDYSTVGVPSAPNSTGGSTKGLKVWANLGAGSAGGFPCGITLSPTNFSGTENFEMHFDLWWNYVKSGVGSTEIAAAGYGTAGTSAQIAGNSFDSTVIGICGDHGTASSVRVYGSSHASSYQDSDHVVTGDLNSPFVYAGTNRNTANGYYAPFFPTQPVPQAQTNLFPRQTALVAPIGNAAFKWHDVSLKKVANTLTYRIDGNLIATVNTVDAGAAGGNYLLFGIFDINGTGSTDIDSTNLQFVVFDNIRITNFPSVVTVSATQPNASEAGPTAGQFQIFRTEPGPAITVNYTIGGTAANGVDYTNALGGPLTGTVNLAVGQTSTNIDIIPVDDSVSELPETIVLTVQDGTGYNGGGDATITISDNDIPTFDVSAVRPTMFERHTNDFITYRLQRRGDLGPAIAGVNLTFSAGAGTSFISTNGIAVNGGAGTADFTISPIDNNTYDGPKTVTVTVAAGTGYAVGTTSPSASGTILDDELPPATSLYSNPLTSAADATNWKITYGTGDGVNFPTNYNVDFGYDLTTDPGGHGIVGLPPSGATTALRITANKQSNPGAAGAVNVYLTNQAFSGDFAVRFSMNAIQGGNLGAGSEGVVFGINHTGTQSNWWYGSGPITGGPWGSDGVWYYLSGLIGSDTAGDYHEFTGLGGTNGNSGWTRILGKNAVTFANVFKNSPGPFSSLVSSGDPSGIPYNGSPVLSQDTSNWSDVEIKQLKNVITLTIDRTPIFVYTNTTVWTGGYLMLGYADPYGGTGGASVGNPDAAGYFSNLRVVQLGTKITAINLGAGTVTINYTTGDADDTTGSYTLQSATDVAGPYTDVSPAGTFTSTGAGAFQVVANRSGTAIFYRLHHK